MSNCSYINPAPGVCQQGFLGCFASALTLLRCHFAGAPPPLCCRSAALCTRTSKSSVLVHKYSDFCVPDRPKWRFGYTILSKMCTKLQDLSVLVHKFHRFCVPNRPICRIWYTAPLSGQAIQSNKRAAPCGAALYIN